ncbi:ComEA family DNA-binding protein [Maribacter sp. 2304DJ31-5]|uniref:ComEA family DNA-binding protein n=1 Tax=Maribacter sp. 2304DJ31-5 TaxID=3386273 RepID=UPI0039BC7367
MKLSHFKFNKQERSGIFYLLLLLVLVQTTYFLYQKYRYTDQGQLVLQTETQREIDELKIAAAKDTVRMYPFNPNFISDYKGYTLGMSLGEIDRLKAFRAKDKFVNSAEEFQKVTHISDALLHRIAPYFKFPDWILKNRQIVVNDNRVKNKSRKTTNAVIEIRDLNSVTAEELKSVRGIGDKLSSRIIKFRNRLGGFIINEQLYDTYALEKEVADRVLLKFKVLKVPSITKMNLNEVTVEELSKLLYIQKQVALAIINYRNVNKTINSFDELLKIKDFPVDKIERIKLYLTLKK